MILFRAFITLGLGGLIGVSNISVHSGHDPADLSHWSIFKCPLNAILDIACPSCGLTRSLLHAAAGQWEQSLSYHPLGLLILALLVMITTGLWFFSKQTAKAWQSIQKPTPLKTRMIWLGASLYCCWGFFLR